ncbi:MAG: hypothetical protein KC619_01520 [Myxococcales bacterium]|nr:hypothetical protein [Myxococcales bacterium]
MTDEWTYEVGTLDTEDPPPDPREAVDSFAALDARGRSSRHAFLAGPVTDCPLPYLDVQIHDEEGTALADVEVTLDFPEGGGRKGTTDDQGRAHFANVDVDTKTLEVEVERTSAAEDEAPTYRARVHRGAAPPPEEEPVEEAPWTPVLYDHPFEVPTSLRHERDDEDESGPEEPPMLSLVEL